MVAGFIPLPKSAEMDAEYAKWLLLDRVVRFFFVSLFKNFFVFVSFVLLFVCSPFVCFLVCLYSPALSVEPTEIGLVESSFFFIFCCVDSTLCIGRMQCATYVACISLSVPSTASVVIGRYIHSPTLPVVVALACRGIHFLLGKYPQRAFIITDIRVHL